MKINTQIINAPPDNVHKGKILCRQIKKDNDTAEPVILADNAAFHLPNGSIIAAAAVNENYYFLLDKGLCLIRFYDKEWNEIKTVGSRMGYLYGDSETGRQRLGFEFPEDMILHNDRILVTDSGNKRLVVLDNNWKLEKVIPLPEFPYKFIFCDQDRVMVSDFDCSVMTVSLKYGFLSMTELDFPVDFSTAFCYGHTCRVTLENTGDRESGVNEQLLLEMPEIDDVTLAREAANFPVLMRIMMAENCVPDVREIALTHEELLPEFARLAGQDIDTEVENHLTVYVEKTINAAESENESSKEEIAKLSFEFIKKYKAIPNSSDTEAANIDKEMIRRHMFLKLKDFRSRLKQIVALKNTLQEVAGLPKPLKVLADFLEKRSGAVKHGIECNLKGIEENLQTFNESDILNFIVHYWLFSEEQRILIGEPGKDEEKLFGDQFLLAILNDFYYTIAELFLSRHKIEEYISFSDREVTMYPDKMHIFKRFLSKLVQLGKYDDVLRMLKKFPDPNKEDVNYFYYQVYLEKGDADNAFIHLKKELDLYSHRVDLIPELIQLKKLPPDQVQHYIDAILEKSPQAIDTHLYAARSFQKIGDDEKAEFYVDRELELFPENKAALLLKHDLFNNHIPSFFPNLDPASFAYFRKTWETFKTFMKLHRDETTALQIISFFTLLNFLPCESQVLKEIAALKEAVMFAVYKKELMAYLSFMKHYRGVTTVGEEAEVETVEKFAPVGYLSAYSTGWLAYDYFFEEARRLADAGQYEVMFPLIEDILKYNPGDEGIFKFLDSI
jgi:tetratricopeptide (TPR) repeat protein